MATVSPAIESHSDDHAHGHDHHELPFWKKYIFSTDHKIIGIQFLITTLIMLMVGGALALGVMFAARGKTINKTTTYLKIISPILPFLTIIQLQI